MAQTYTTLTDVIGGESPFSLAAHSVKRDYNILGISDFIKQHGSTSFDMAMLRSNFKTICEDYAEPLTLDGKSKAVEFCSKIIYEVGPESRQVKKADRDKVWKFRFCYYEANKRLVVNTAFVGTFKANDSNVTGTGLHKKIILTVTQAELLAMDTFDKINEIAYAMTPSVMLMTPLAGAIFSKDDIPKITREMNGNNNLRTLLCINSSCQSGGQYLANSRLHIAAIFAIVANKGLKDEKIKIAIIAKTMRQYIGQNKPWDNSKFMIYSKHAHGGVPGHLSPEKFMKSYENIKENTVLQYVKAAKASGLRSTVETPGQGKS